MTGATRSSSARSSSAASSSGAEGIWARASRLWPAHIDPLSPADRSDASALMLYLLLPLTEPDAQLPEPVQVALGNLLHRAGATDGDPDAQAKLDAYFQALPISDAAKAALAAFLDELFPAGVALDGAADAVKHQLGAIGVEVSHKPVGSDPAPPGSVRGAHNLRFSK